MPLVYFCREGAVSRTIRKSEDLPVVDEFSPADQGKSAVVMGTGIKKGNPRTVKGSGIFFMRNSFLTIVCMLILTIPGALSAQSTVKVTGRVLDARTGTPLNDAHVSVTGTGFGAVTDALGRYSIENVPAGEYRLRVSYVGYKTELSEWIRIESDHITTLDFFLTVQPIESEELVVEAAPYRAENVIDATAAMEIITREEIELGGYQSVGEALQGASGIFVRSTGGAGGQQTVSIRGSKSEHVMVVLDGVRVSKPHGGPADLSMIPVSAVDKITIVKGGNSAAFGADALGGVVYIETGAPDDAPLRQIRGQAGSFGSKNMQGALGRSWNRVQFSGNYEYRISDGDFSYRGADGARNIRKNADISMHNAFGKMRYAGDRQALSLSGFYTASRRGLPGFIYNLSGDARSDDSQKIINVQYDRKQSGSVDLRFSSSYNGYSDEDKQESYPPYHTRHKSYSINNQAQARIHWTGHISTIAGISHRVDEGELNFRRMVNSEPGIKTNRISSVHIYNEYSRPMKILLRNITWVTALWYSHVHNRKGYMSPKIGFSGLLAGPFAPRLKVNWSKSFHLPDFYDMYYEGYRTMGNPDLRPETGNSIDAGCALSFSFMGTGSLEGSYFRNDVKDLIHWRQQFDGVFYPVNLSKALIYGSEWKGEWHFPENLLSVKANYTYMKALNKTGDRTTDGKILTNRPVHMASVQGSLNLKSLTFSCRRRHVSRRYVREANSKWIPPYSVTDVFISMDIPLDKANIHTHFGMYNIGDISYTIVERAPMPGREIRLTMECTF